MRTLKLFSAAVVAASLIACGGGGGEPTSTAGSSSATSASIIASGYSINWFLGNGKGLTYYGHNCQRGYGQVYGEQYYEVYSNGFAYNLNTPRGHTLPSGCVIDTVLKDVKPTVGPKNALYTAKFRNNPLFAHYYDYDERMVYIVKDLSLSYSLNYKLTEVINAGLNAILTDDAGKSIQVSIYDAKQIIQPTESEITLYQPSPLYYGQGDEIFDIGSSIRDINDKPYEIGGATKKYSTSGCRYASNSDYTVYNNGAIDSIGHDNSWGSYPDSCSVTEIFDVLPQFDKDNINARAINTTTFIDSNNVYYDTSSFSPNTVDSTISEIRLLSIINGGYTGIIGSTSSTKTGRISIKSVYQKSQ